MKPLKSAIVCSSAVRTRRIIYAQQHSTAAANINIAMLRIQSNFAQRARSSSVLDLHALIPVHAARIGREQPQRLHPFISIHRSAANSIRDWLSRAQHALIIHRFANDLPSRPSRALRPDTLFLLPSAVVFTVPQRTSRDRRHTRNLRIIDLQQWMPAPEDSSSIGTDPRHNKLVNSNVISLRASIRARRHRNHFALDIRARMNLAPVAERNFLHHPRLHHLPRFALGCRKRTMQCHRNHSLRQESKSSQMQR